MKNFKISEKEQQIIQQFNRKIAMPTSTFSILRMQLAKNMGENRIRDVLFDFGFDMGMADGKEAVASGKTQEELVQYGPLLHIEQGHIAGVEHDCDVRYNKQGQLISLLGSGKWFGSYEATEHVRAFGEAIEPICHTLTGYASGYMSTVFNESVIAREIKCVGKGDACCEWIIKPQQQWQMEADDSLPMQTVPMVEELQYTYEQLVQRDKFITKISDLQKHLTTEIINGQDLYHILNLAYEVLRIPIIVRGTKTKTMTYAGLSEKKFAKLEQEFKAQLACDEFMQGIFTSTTKTHKTIELKSHIRIVTPIYVQEELTGWCTSIFEYRQPDERDHLLLDRLAHTVALLLLNEKTRFESFERMKGNFFEQILTGSYNEKELKKRGNFANVDLDKAYYIAVLEVESTNAADAFYVQERIFDESTLYFKKQQQHILMGHRDGHLTLFLTVEHAQWQADEQINAYYQFLQQQFPKATVKLGYSNQQMSIATARKAYDEAVIALKLTLKQPIASYGTLGIIGILMNRDNFELIKDLASQQLGALYTNADVKSRELLKTLYAFLRNGGNLEQTKADLILSMSGLRHRIQKIEQLLQKDIRNPQEMYQLLLILQALVIANELDLT